MGEAAYTQVTILGEKYRISGDAESASVPELAAYVDDKMNEVKQCSSIIDPKHLAVITALNLADELFGERARFVELLRELSERTQEIGLPLDATLSTAEEGADSKS
jgi:cell division protein ZapA